MKVVRKKTTARAAVVRERKLAEPLAPNRLPEAPLPKAAPTSAPLPCWSRTRPMMKRATTTSTMSITVNQKSMLHSPELSPRRGADRDEILGHERSPADQAAVDVRLRKQLPGVSGFDAAPVEDRQIPRQPLIPRDRKSTRLNSSHLGISYAVFCLKKKK